MTTLTSQESYYAKLFIMCICTGLPSCQYQKLATKDLQLFSIFLPMWNELSHLYVQLAKK